MLGVNIGDRWWLGRDGAKRGQYEEYSDKNPGTGF
jgi:hypothetical protein